MHLNSCTLHNGICNGETSFSIISLFSVYFGGDMPDDRQAAKPCVARLYEDKCLQ